MAYRKQWYTYGVRTNAGMLSVDDSLLTNGDTFFSMDYEKPMYLNDMSLLGNFLIGKIWLNEDMVYGSDASNGGLCQLGAPVTILSGSLYSPNNIALPLIPAGANDFAKYVGIIAWVPYNVTSSFPQGRGIAIQGMYNVRFTEETTYVQEGNLALLSSTSGRAAQGGAVGELGVIGVIMESKTLGVDKLALVMIQSFSSK